MQIRLHLFLYHMPTLLTRKSRTLQCPRNYAAESDAGQILLFVWCPSWRACLGWTASLLMLGFPRHCYDPGFRQFFSDGGNLGWRQFYADCAAPQPSPTLSPRQPPTRIRSAVRRRAGPPDRPARRAGQAPWARLDGLCKARPSGPTRRLRGPTAAGPPLRPTAAGAEPSRLFAAAARLL